MRSIKIASGAVLLGLLVWACSDDATTNDLTGVEDAGADSNKTGGDDSTGDDSTGDDDTTADATTTDDSSTTTDGGGADSGPGYSVGGNLTGLYLPPPAGDAGADSGVADSGVTDSGVMEAGADAGPPPPPPGSVVLQNNAGDDLVLSANGAFAFAKKVSGAYAVTVKAQPSMPAQTCTVTMGSGTASANVTNVAVSCTRNSYNVGGTVTGLTAGTLVLQNKAGDDKTITADGAYNFATKVLSGDAYDVTVKTQPANLVCNVVGGSGVVGGANVTTANVTCLPFKSCQEIKTANAAAASGEYTVDSDGAGANAPFKVYCDMTTNGGGWTLVLDQNVDFGGAGAGYMAVGNWAVVNAGTPNNGQYSIMDRVGTLKAGTDYEFLMTWTGGNTAANSYAQWKQTQNPTTVDQTSAVTFSNYTSSPANLSGCNAFAGLAKHASAYLAGERSCYWFALGVPFAYSGGGQSGIPAYDKVNGAGTNNGVAKRSKLWVR